MKKLIYKFLFQKWWGWKIETGFPKNTPQAIVIVLHHTSNWDFPVGIFLRKLVDTRIGFIGKDSLFKFPLGVLMRYMGGYPVDRRKKGDFVGKVVEIFKKEAHFIVAIAPEGTRRKVEALKTGFYHIAHNAGVPIVACKFDWGKKVVGFDQPFYTTGDYMKDLKQILAYYIRVDGKNPEWDFDISTVIG